MRTGARLRREVRATTLRRLRFAFRYSHSRNAYVLRGIGDRYGPVLRPKEPPSPEP